MSSNNSKGTILIIEDQPAFRLVYVSVLKADGYEVLEAEDGEAGVQAIQESRPDLVLLDLVIPKLDGLEVLTKIREMESIKNTPVLIFSVLGEQVLIQEGLKLGAKDYAVKGACSPKEILGKIRAILSKGNLEKGLLSYALSVKDGWGDSAKLQADIGLTTSFNCPDCRQLMVLKLLPDYTRQVGHWFAAHFACPYCKREF